MKRRLLLALALAVCCGVSAQITSTAKDIAPKMIPGWNLGNTMEGGSNQNEWKNAGVNTEISWQSTKTSQAVIDLVHNSGFKSVRIPCSWVMGHITDKANVTIDPAWLARVKEVVDYCINDGMYVVLNDHWDGGWLENDGFTSGTNITEKKEQLTKLWTNIANYFKDYDEHLIFAGLNEPGVGGASPDASGSKVDNKTLTSRLLEYEQTFINAVRATGGNNATRILVVQGPNTNIDNSTDASLNYDVTTLTDPAGAGRLMVEVHEYDPYSFTQQTKDESWGKQYYYWSRSNHYSSSTHNATWGEESYMAQQFNKLQTKFVNNGYPVIIGEYAANWRKMPANGESQKKHDASIKSWYQVVTQYAASRGIVPFVWDINSPSQNGTKGTMTIFNRNTLKVFNQNALDGIMQGVTNGINDIKVTKAKNADDTIYTIEGIAVGKDETNLAKGIYIRGGEKFVKN